MILNSYHYHIAHQTVKENGSTIVLSCLSLTNTELSPKEAGLSQSGNLLRLHLHHVPITSRNLQHSSSSNGPFRTIAKNLQSDRS